MAKVEEGAVAEGAEAEAGAENEVEQEGAFDEAVAIGGGDVKTDTLFTKAVGNDPSNEQVKELTLQTGNRCSRSRTPISRSLDPRSYRKQSPNGYCPSGI